MSSEPYEGLPAEKMILRDDLAIDRTKLANERTFLAYLRTGAALITGGAVLNHFVSSFDIKLLGLFFIPVGGAVVFIGIRRYRKVASGIRLKTGIMI